MMISATSGCDCGWHPGAHRHAARYEGAKAAGQEILKRDLFGGDLFVFRGRSGDMIKILWHDSLGLSLYAKRLERGRFVWPSTLSAMVAFWAARLAADGDRLALARSHIPARSHGIV